MSDPFNVDLSSPFGGSSTGSTSLSDPCNINPSSPSGLSDPCNIDPSSLLGLSDPCSIDPSSPSGSPMDARESRALAKKGLPPKQACGPKVKSTSVGARLPAGVPLQEHIDANDGSMLMLDGVSVLGRVVGPDSEIETFSSHGSQCLGVVLREGNEGSGESPALQGLSDLHITS
eukprot:CAMPEP_0172807906 /NCGR_PEP_ID=MMETSP1075-20121228/7329_1 /TAXON_ID=2916 /ORGANISM="Ceratium fusus, Strain PA161109" /LENGTH=173 /DNA_ID=CAMNT_0013646963 /DNA_START=320 /DNA_END=841 /DNA_ORIENTATION=-